MTSSHAFLPEYAHHVSGLSISGLETRLEGDPVIGLSPIDREPVSHLLWTDDAGLDQAIVAASAAFRAWRLVPAPRRGEFVRRIGEEVREHKEKLAEYITLEVGKTRSEAAGEVQEWIDMCEFAVGLSRQLHGLTIVSERPGHRMMEQWHPLGPVGVISAFNFPMAVWAWNAMLAFVCGDPVIWKPSEKAPLCAVACQAIVQRVAAQFGDAPTGLSSLVVGDARLGQQLAADARVPLVSATGSVRMGRAVAQTVAGRLGRYLLELGGNNALIVTESARLDLALRAIVFSAVGTTGQRCTTLRRLIVHRSRRDELLPLVARAFDSVKVGDPRMRDVLAGPLIDREAWERMQSAVARARAEGGQVLCGGDRVVHEVPTGGFYVRPCLIDISANASVVWEETFAPILYVLTYDTWEEAVALQNAAREGLSSAVFTESLRDAERFLGPAGSDCGIANVNIGTSGAEIGGAFGGEKDTGGGRESGSDAWKNYMRRATNTVNYGDSLPLAQGVTFDV